MFTIKNIENVIIINKSKFITNLIQVDSISEVDNHLNNIKNKYKDATHNSYAYIIDNIKRFSDDNEPSGTAGLPILNSLEKNNLNHVLCIVTRYFGGIKLGAKNLLRAYSNSTSTAIKNTNKLELINGFEVEISFNYEKVNEIETILNKCEIINKTFNSNIAYTAYIDNNILNKLKEICDVSIKKEVIIKKEI